MFPHVCQYEGYNFRNAWRTRLMTAKCNALTLLGSKAQKKGGPRGQEISRICRFQTIAMAKFVAMLKNASHPAAAPKNDIFRKNAVDLNFSTSDPSWHCITCAMYKSWIHWADLWFLAKTLKIENILLQLETNAVGNHHGLAGIHHDQAVVLSSDALLCAYFLQCFRQYFWQWCAAVAKPQRITLKKTLKFYKNTKTRQPVDSPPL